MIAGWILTILYFYRREFEVKQSNFIRGRDIVSAKELKRLIEKDNKVRNYEGYKIANIPYSFSGETQHTMIAGSTGSGKAVLICEVLEQIKARGDKAIIYDFTGTFTERFYDPAQDIILNPFDSRSKGWSIFKEVEHELKFDTIAEAL